MDNRLCDSTVVSAGWEKLTKTKQEVDRMTSYKSINQSVYYAQGSTIENNKTNEHKMKTK